MGLDIFFINESTKVTDLDVYDAAYACDYQAHFHYGRSGWRSDVRCIFAVGGAQAKIPAGAALITVRDALDVSGALGFHDEDGNEVPFGQIGVDVIQQSGAALSEVCSHEALELATDPNVNLSALSADGKRLYAVEVGDPVQGSAYDFGEPEGRSTGVVVANFALPAYFDPTTKAEKVDFRGVLAAPFTISPQGYMSYIDLTNVAAGWQQERGAEVKTVVPDKDDRVLRRS